MRRRLRQVFRVFFSDPEDPTEWHFSKEFFSERGANAHIEKVTGRRVHGYFQRRDGLEVGVPPFAKISVRYAP